ncbi:hypothetical protein BJ508DRAFT_336899 [Ascobolus immersus RN42]|uniref:FAR1 domain-containing protein n=1 Tax=Ascobolus immersus RN42 TaxID=1160509 RepID=A0A3N4HBX3_ASCIM|nr:hypothetical protein BJ508DRAFT_336899 [Ascobolus immersus RN42]
MASPGSSSYDLDDYRDSVEAPTSTDDDSFLYYSQPLSSDPSIGPHASDGPFFLAPVYTIPDSDSENEPWAEPNDPNRVERSSAHANIDLLVSSSASMPPNDNDPSDFSLSEHDSLLFSNDEGDIQLGSTLEDDEDEGGNLSDTDSNMGKDKDERDGSDTAVQGQQELEQMMPAPPSLNRAFDTPLPAIQYCQEWAKAHGYALSILSTPGKNKQRYILVCDKGGDSSRRQSRRDKAIIQRRREGRKERPGGQGTSKEGCNFRLTLRYWKTDCCWHIIPTQPEHSSHGPNKPEGLPRHQRLTDEQLKHVEVESNAGVTAANILASLKERWPDCHAKRRTIYNAQAALRRKALAGRSEMQALLDEFDEDAGKSDIRYAYTCDPQTSEVERLFFTNKYSRKRAFRHNEVSSGGLITPILKTSWRKIMGEIAQPLHQKSGSNEKWSSYGRTTGNGPWFKKTRQSNGYRIKIRRDPVLFYTLGHVKQRVDPENPLIGVLPRNEAPSGTDVLLKKRILVSIVKEGRRNGEKQRKLTKMIEELGGLEG